MVFFRKLKKIRYISNFENFKVLGSLNFIKILYWTFSSLPTVDHSQVP